MDLRYRAPRRPLDSFVASIWVCRSDPQPNALERILPIGAPQLIVNLKDDQTRLYDPERPFQCVSTTAAILSGIQSRFQIIDTSEQEYVAGVAFKPGGTVPFMPVPAHEMSNADVPLEALWGRSRTAVLRERLLAASSPDDQLDILESTLAEMWTPAGVHPAVAFALSAFERVPLATSIEAVTNAIGLSAKRFIERFKSEVGVAPKRYCRLRRFQKAVALAHRGRDVDWATVALDCGYFDQAHFIHDFRSFAGVTPASYEAARTEFQNHVKFLQS